VRTPLVTETRAVDGRGLPLPAEPGSDALLLLGLLVAAAAAEPDRRLGAGGSVGLLTA
jgi:hypothetical protein